MESPNRKYNGRIDVLRGVAAWWVVFHHASIFGQSINVFPQAIYFLQETGWLAITLFLMVSGYSLGMGVRGKNIIWSGYFKARWLRIAPLYLFLLFVGISTSPFGSFAEIFSAVTLLPIPGALTPQPWLATAWSVRLEFALYFTVPILFFVLNRNRPLIAIASIAGLGIFFIASSLAMGFNESTVVTYSIPTRFFEFSIGFIFGFYSRSIRAKNGWVALISAIIFVGAAVYLFAVQGGYNEMEFWARIVIWLLTCVFSLFLIFWANQNGGGSTSPNYFTQLMRNLGTWSYSTYLLHIVVISVIAQPLSSVVTDWLGITNHFFVTGIDILVTFGSVLLVSVLSYRVIELPFLSMRPNYVKTEIK